MDSEKENLNNDDVDLLRLIGIFWRYRYLIIGLTLLGALVTSALIFLGKDDSAVHTRSPHSHYEAKASIYFSSNRQNDSDLGHIGGEIYRSRGAYERVKKNVEVFEIYEKQGEKLGEMEKRARFSELLETTIEADVLMVSFFHPDKSNALEAMKILTKFFEERMNSLEKDIDYTFLQAPEVVEGKVIYFDNPKRNLVYIIFGGLIGLVLSLCAAISLNFIRRVRNDPEALKRVKGEMD